MVGADPGMYTFVAYVITDNWGIGQKTGGWTLTQATITMLFITAARPAYARVLLFFFI